MDTLNTDGLTVRHKIQALEKYEADWHDSPDSTRSSPRGLSFAEYQMRAGVTRTYPDSFKLMYPAIAAGGELGEMLNEVKRIIRDDVGVVTEERKKKILNEVGDTLWYLSQICVDLGFTLEDAAWENMTKLADRAARNVINGSGGDR